MFLNKIDDPRDNLEKARRLELVRFANAHGLSHITGDFPAILIRSELRARGLTNINIPPRPLGAQNQPNAMTPGAAPPVNQNVVEIGAAADLARQFRQEQARPAAPPLAPADKPQRLVERPRSEINRLRDYCKANGIKMERRDNLASLKAKIEAHGRQNPSQLRQ